ncbi:MAG: von Willebrand factor type A domain-containing protein [Anaerolineae bacterium]|nr:von Willebrand factor type A domain-containing protein [Anaerolineae bacterium]
MQKKVVRWSGILLLLALMPACAFLAAPTAAVDTGVVQERDQVTAVDEDVKTEVEEAPAEEQEAEEEFYAEAPAAPEAFDSAAAGAVPLPAGTPAALDAEEGEQPDTMIFEDYGTNPFVVTAVDNLSTFAVDVDTGSYTLTRSYLNDYLLPPPEAIRLEEFVNYFDQDYPLPEQGETFSIVTEAAPVPFAAQGNLVMRVGIQGYDIAPEDRPDALLIFVIDISGSMDMENRLGAVKEALYTLTAQLRPTDQVGIVVYGSTGRVLLEPTPVSQGQEIGQAIGNLLPDGSTNAEEGLNLAYQMATAHYDADKINRLILCSDGVANVGSTGPDAILETVRTQAREGITLTTVGFGLGNYNDVLMEQLADDGDGQYFYVDSQDEARRIFVEKLTGTLQTIARDAKIQVEFNPETVEYYRLMGYENRDVADEDFRNDEVDAGEIGAGHSVTALYEIVPIAGASGNLATVRLRWQDPESDEVYEIEQSQSAGDVYEMFEDAPPHFRLDAAVAAFADLLGEGAWMQNASYDVIGQIARKVSGDLQGNEEVEGFVEVVDRAASLSQ